MFLRLLGFFIVFTLLSCSVTPPEKKEIKKSKNKIEIVFEGVIYPSKSHKIVSPISARIKKVYIQNGDSVKAGEKLIEFDDSNAQIDYKKALIDYKIAKIKAQKIYTPFIAYNTRVLIDNAKEKLLKIYLLYKKGYTSLSELKNAENEYENLINSVNVQRNDFYSNSASRFKSQKEAEEAVKKALLEVERLRHILKYRYIKSPINGIVVGLKILSGTTVGQNDILGEIMNIDRVKLKGAFFPGTYRFLRVGMLAKVQCLTTPTYEGIGAIEKISPVVDPATGRMSLYMTLKNKNYILQPGTKCLITFTFKKKDVKAMGLDVESKKIYIRSKIKSSAIK